MVKYIIVYLIVINLWGYISMGVDKQRAKKKQYRIPERTLFTIAILGGSIGSMLGMKKFRHKTLHKSFIYGMPTILVLQIIVSIAGVLIFLQS